MKASWYDVLDVEPTASADEIRAAWRQAVAELDPTDRRFRVFNEAGETLLDPARRASYDAELAAHREDARADTRDSRDEAGDEAPDEAVPAVTTAAAASEPGRGSRRPRLGWLAERRVPLVPGWALLVVAALLAASLVGVGFLLSKPSDAAVESDTEAAQAAAEQAIVPVLSYDAHHLSESQAAAEPFMTAGEKQQYDKLFAVIRQNAPRTGTVVQAKYLSSGIVRSGTDQVDVLVFVDQVTRNKQHPKVPVVYKNQVTVTMAKVGGDWLVDNLTTDSNPA